MADDPSKTAREGMTAVPQKLSLPSFLIERPSGPARRIRISRKPAFAVDKFRRKSNGCCGTEVKALRSGGGRPWNVECLFEHLSRSEVHDCALGPRFTPRSTFPRRAVLPSLTTQPRTQRAFLRAN